MAYRTIFYDRLGRVSGTTRVVASVEHYERLSEVARRDYRARAVGLNPQTMTELARIDAGLKARCSS